MSLDKALTEMVKNVPECIAAGWVDINTGMLLGVKTVDSHPQEVLDLVAAATTDLFQGSNVVAIETLFKKSRGVPDSTDHYFKEIIVLSQNLIHVFSRGKKKQQHKEAWIKHVANNLGFDNLPEDLRCRCEIRYERGWTAPETIEDIVFFLNAARGYAVSNDKN